MTEQTVPAISLTNLSKTYKNGKKALKGIDLTVEAGDFFALLGPNGAGKSTTIGIVTGLVEKTAGRIEIFGHDLELNPYAAKSLLGVVPQEFNFNQFELVEEIIINQAGYYGIHRHQAKTRCAELLEILELSDKKRVMARQLSGGMKRRLMIARALIHQPKLLILDEPTAGVDIEIRRATWDLLKEINAQGTTIILTTHYLEEAELLCRNLAIINHGNIIEQAPINTFLRRLQQESFILNIQNEIHQLPTHDHFIFTLIDSRTLEVVIEKPHTIHSVFEFLTSHGIVVETLRNKSNRLEELFLSLTSGKEILSPDTQ